MPKDELIKFLISLFENINLEGVIFGPNGEIIYSSFVEPISVEKLKLILTSDFCSKNCNIDCVKFFQLKIGAKKLGIIIKTDNILINIDDLIESSFDGLYITDVNANTIKVNKAYERITGLKRENLIGKNMKELVEREIMDTSVTFKVLEQKKPVTIMQKIMRDKKVMVTGNPIFNKDGNISYVVTNVRDVTELVDLRMKLEETGKLSSLYYEALREERQYKSVLDNLIVKNATMQKVIYQAIKVAGVDSSILLTGESGVGKTLLAKIIHQCSKRKEKPFVKINCGAIPETLIESELFGYEKGAFTGALTTGKAGLIEMADGGTLFLDEVSELTPNAQVKLLTVLEEKIFTRVGGTKSKKVDVRIIAATNVDLKKSIKNNEFRTDLYYRLNVIPIYIPSLSERKEEIPLFIHKFIEDFNKRTQLNKRLSPMVIEKMICYSFPGNIRELRNMVERMLILSENNEATLSDLPHEISSTSYFHEDISENKTLKEVVDSIEKNIIERTIKKHKNLSQAAKALNIHPSTLLRKIAKYNIKK